ncbi:MAG TPA: dihydropyrimidinase [Symbiobacteriaceae bacterium]|jgi:dihydropyrimidinase
MTIVIEGGTVVSAVGRFKGDVRIEGGRIAAVGLGVKSPGDTVLDASGCFVLPGAIDPHTHIEMPSGGGFNADTWYSGTVAAAFGGTTTVIDMITPERGRPLAEALGDWQARARPGAMVDYGFHMSLIEARPETLAEIPAMVRAGVPSFKLYLAYKALMLSDAEAFAAMRAIGRAGGLALIHSENGEVIDLLVAEAVARGETAPKYHAATRPAAAEAEATARACRLAELAEARLYVVHISCREALAEVLQARSRGLKVDAETCTQYLVFTAADLDQPDFAGSTLICSPPVRTDADRDALWKALAARQVDVVASDHCPWTQAQRERGRDRLDRIPGGLPGLEERIPFLYTYGVEEGAISLEELVALTATNPARIFGLHPAKGSIAPGADADVVVWDPMQTRIWSAATHHTLADQTPYENLPVHGAARHVLVRGRPVVQNEALAGEAGYGKFLPRSGGPSSAPQLSKRRIG